MISRRQGIVLGMYIVNLVLTYLSNTGAYGSTNAQVSDKYQTMITPPGYAFSIWALIFVWEGVSCVAQCLPRYRDNANPFNRDAAVFGWAITCVGQGCWSIAFAQSQMALSLAILIVCWLGLLTTVLVVGQSVRELCPNNHPARFVWPEWTWPSALSWALFVAPFSLHCGWLTVATCLNGSLLAVSECSSLASQLSLAVLTIVFCTVMVVVLSVERRNTVYAAAVSWAFLSLRDRDMSKPICTAEDAHLLISSSVNDFITTVAVVLGSVFLCFATVRLFFGDLPTVTETQRTFPTEEKFNVINQE
jgi:hypothetical protein